MSIYDLSFIDNSGNEIELKNVKTKILNEMNNLKLKTTEQSFSRNIRNKDYQFSNLIGVNPNAKGPYILLGAHLDSPQIDGCESTIDAATSIAIILELVKNILKTNPNFPIMIVFVDGEEAIDGGWSDDNTLSGSNYFVNNYNLALINKVYIFDLIGGDIENNKIAAFDNNPTTFNDMKKLAEINSKYENKIFINPDTLTSSNNITDDHVPFKEKGKYSLNLIPYIFPKNHHKLEDNYQNVNWTYVEVFYNVFYDFLSINN
jgi:Zn-dependent M28 family amino/carboxypeptidase